MGFPPKINSELDNIGFIVECLNQHDNVTQDRILDYLCNRFYNKGGK